MDGTRYDVIVVGGGPGGASAAAMLAGAGLRVLVLERERFPRFHVGESLLPAAWELWSRLGVSDRLEAEGFTVKQGVMFGMFGAARDVPFLTAEFPDLFRRPWTYHVERSRFDEILLDHARQRGAEVREGWSVKDVLFDADRAVGVLAGPTGAAPRPIHAPVVVDATGRDCLLARRLGWRRPDPALNRISHFTHFRGGHRRDPGEFLPPDQVFPTSTATDIHTVDGGWIWYIPMKDDVVSVGIVVDARSGRARGGPQARFDAAVQSCAKIRDWLGGAEQILEMQTISNISYLNDSFVGNGFVLVGDAAMFVDPIFSAGVTLAMRAGVYAADAIIACHADGDFSAARLAPYEARIRKPMGAIFKMIYNWYQILERKDANNIISRSLEIPVLRERFVLLLSGGYDRMDLERILDAAGERA